MGRTRPFRPTTNTREIRQSNAGIRQSNAVRSQSRTPDYSLSAIPDQNFLKTTGGIMLGAHGGFAQSLSISSGILDLTTNASGKTVKRNIPPIVIILSV